ncbi:hypothetical protein [Pseudonocardia xinjiangensis]|uniref:DUF998 domain-containing protein n=1 Tax=Pseudonocardia xinjiangensis TaxID=75289 RepID=A0ABX1R6N4_9PSEU|nr:hypothetical protein [Pseudonocardia xinjiangensis]NMH76051.1 hypothetical protein [Pseudonocardia xinjiangensis]
MTTASDEIIYRVRTGGEACGVSRAAVVTGGSLWALAALQYAVTHVVAANAWTVPRYDWLHNGTSNLANTQCGLFAAPNASPTYVCSPLHDVVNASFVLTGVLVIVGALLLRRFWPTGWLIDAAMVLWILLGFGKILIGFAPENTDIGLHLMGSLNVPLGSVAILLMISRTDRWLGVAGLVLGLLGLAGTVLSTVGEYAGPGFYLGLGPGGMDRVAAYPAILWLFMAGTATIVRTVRPGRETSGGAAGRLPLGR